MAETITIVQALKRLRDELLAWSANNFHKKLDKQFNSSEGNKVLETDMNGNIITAEKLDIVDDDKEAFKIVDKEGRIALEVKKDGSTYVGDLVIQKTLSDSSIQETNVLDILNNKVDKVDGFGLSQNSFTNEEKDKLTAINKNDDITEILSGSEVAMQLTPEEVSTNKLKINELSFGGYKIIKNNNNNGLLWIWEEE